MQHVTAEDGTSISFRAGGDGEPVLFVHGALTSSSDWVFVARLLRDRFTTVTFDRRGRGRSGFGEPPYSITQEAGDIAAVAAQTGARNVVAHSYGALCTMVALDQGLEVDRVVLYEPPVSLPRGAVGPHSRLAADIEAGRHDVAAATFLSATGASEEDIEAIRRSPAWPGVVASVPALTRELDEVQDWTTPAGPFDVPALLLLGGETTSRAYLDGIPGLERAFPQLRRHELAGQRHVGHIFAPEAFAAAVDDFLARPR